MLGSEIEVLNGALIEEASQERTCRVLDLFATVAPDFDDYHQGGQNVNANLLYICGRSRMSAA